MKNRLPKGLCIAFERFKTSTWHEVYTIFEVVLLAGRGSAFEGGGGDAVISECLQAVLGRRLSLCAGAVVERRERVTDS